MDPTHCRSRSYGLGPASLDAQRSDLECCLLPRRSCREPNSIGGCPNIREILGEERDRKGVMRNATRSRVGFTLIEMLIVISLLGLIVAVMAPQTAGFRARLATVHAADEFVSAVAVAQGFALRHGGLAEIHIDPDADRFWVESDTTLARRGVKDTIGQVVDLAAATVTVSSGASVICFSSRGIAVESSGCSSPSTTVVFSRESFADSVRITALGKAIR